MSRFLLDTSTLLALRDGAMLVHKDPEFEKLPRLLEERLPYK